MRNEKLQKAAHRFADLVREIDRAKRSLSGAQNTVSNLQGEMAKIKTEMREYVGANKPHRIEATPAGTVTITYKADTLNPEVCLFDADGEEVNQ
jgi:hypothetical protein